MGELLSYTYQNGQDDEKFCFPDACLSVGLSTSDNLSKN